MRDADQTEGPFVQPNQVDHKDDQSPVGIDGENVVIKAVQNGRNHNT